MLIPKSFDTQRYQTKEKTNRHTRNLGRKSLKIQKSPSKEERNYQPQILTEKNLK